MTGLSKHGDVAAATQARRANTPKRASGHGGQTLCDSLPGLSRLSLKPLRGHPRHFANDLQQVAM